jgi:hypothetical protein
MKIQFLEVYGHVVVDDKHIQQTATSGMILDVMSKPYIILVGNNSKAHLRIESKEMWLNANSVLYTNHERPTQLQEAVHDVRMFMGKIWAKIDNNEWEPEAGNAAVGVRG